MKAVVIPLSTLLFAAGVLLLIDPAAASLKRAIVLERPDIGFPRLIDTWEQQRLRLAPIPHPSFRTTATEEKMATQAQLIPIVD
jgi:hypothetical protein